MRAVIVTGLVTCLAGVAYAEGTGKDKDMSKERTPSASSKSSSDTNRKTNVAPTFRLPARRAAPPVVLVPPAPLRAAGDVLSAAIHSAQST